MKTILLSPELFNAEGGIARIMRLYLKALCELAGPADQVVSIALNDRSGSDIRLGRYSTTALLPPIGCGRNKMRFIRETFRHADSGTRMVCGHLHQLPIAWLIKRVVPGIRYHLVAHGIEVWRPYSSIEVSAMLGAEGILCVSEYTRRQMLRFCPRLDPARLTVLHNTLDPYFSPEATARHTLSPVGTPRILTVARLAGTDTYKGVDTLIEALPALVREYPHARLRVVGKGDDLPRLQALTHRMRVADRVDFTGGINDESLHAEYAACDVFALPSRKEGFGLVYLEAMTYGKACLGARAGGVPEVINHDVGALAEYGNISEIAAALSDLTSHPRDPAAVRRHADRFAFPAFRQRLAASLA